MIQLTEKLCESSHISFWQELRHEARRAQDITLFGHGDIQLHGRQRLLRCIHILCEARRNVSVRQVHRARIWELQERVARHEELSLRCCQLSLMHIVTRHAFSGFRMVQETADKAPVIGIDVDRAQRASCHPADGDTFMIFEIIDEDRCSCHRLREDPCRRRGQMMDRFRFEGYIRRIRDSQTDAVRTQIMLYRIRIHSQNLWYT